MPILLLKAHPAVQGGNVSKIETRLQRLAARRGDPTVLLLPSPGEPTADEARSGEYSKLRDTWRGQAVKIESPAGTVRRGTNRLGITWEQRILFDYGEFVGTMGVDGDPVDVFFGPAPDATMVYVIHQRRINDWTEFDEDKCMVDFPDEEAAKAAFLACYNDPRFLGPITAMPVEEFIVKLRATRDAPAMIKAQDFGTMVLFAKAHVGAYLRRGRLVNLAGYQGRDASAKPAPGQLALFPAAPPAPMVQTPPPAPAAPPKPPHPLEESAARIAKLEDDAKAAEARGDDRMAGFYRGPLLNSHRAMHAKLESAFGAYNKVGDGTELSTDDGKRHAILLPDASSPGKYRYQMFDEHGFSAHSTHNSPEEAVADAARTGYHVPNPGILDKLAGTDEWAHGMAINAIVQALNGKMITRDEADKQFAELQAARDAKRNPPPAEPAAAVSEHPAPTPRMQLRDVPEERRAEWLDLHQRQHELHHYELGQTKERRERARAKMYAAQTKMREAEHAAASFRKDGLPGAEDRAREFDAAANRHRADFERHRGDVDRESAMHQQLYEQVAKLGRQKDTILPLSGDLSIDWPAQRQRTSEEQAKHEKEMLAMYRAHYKEMGKKKPMAKAWSWLDTPSLKPQFVLLV